MPVYLMVLMRHENIETTLKYYVGRKAYKTAENLWEAYRKSNKISNSTSSTTNRNRGAVCRKLRLDIKLNTNYPAWTRTRNEGTKIPCVTITPRGIHLYGWNVSACFKDIVLRRRSARIPITRPCSGNRSFRAPKTSITTSRKLSTTGRVRSPQELLNCSCHVRDDLSLGQFNRAITRKVDFIPIGKRSVLQIAVRQTTGDCHFKQRPSNVA
jgi:hypothetical protein